MSRFVCAVLVAISVAVVSVPAASAQQAVEINPYFGGVWPDSTAIGELKTNALWGVRAGFHLNPSFSLEGNVGYLNHFEVKGIDPKSRGFLYEVAPTYLFSEQDWPLPSSFTPHLNFGIGGITTSMDDPDKFTFNVFDSVQFLGGPTQTRVRRIEMSSGDTFFTVSAGGGITVGRGPIAFRGDLRARMLPNYYKSSPIWMEAAVGVSFRLGNRP
jgi:Outer membrane protein beta-barrel domain